MIRPQPKPPKSVQDEARLDFVRRMPCLIWQYSPDLIHQCGIYGVEAHHVRKGTHAGARRKPTAEYTVPLCHAAHSEYHTIGHDTFCAKYGLDLEAHLRRINAEFAKLHPAKPKRERKKSPGLKSITVQCAACGKVEHVPAGKLSRFGAGLRYRCLKTGSLEVVRVA